MRNRKTIFWLAGAIIAIGIGIALVANNPSNTKNDTGIGPSQLKGLTADYSNRHLVHFPKEVLSDTSVEYLNLSNNKMTGIPAEIGQLKNLKTLNYANNQLSGLPMELGNLTQLKILDLSGNPHLSQHDLAAIKQKLPNTQIEQ